MQKRYDVPVYMYLKNVNKLTFFFDIFLMQWKSIGSWWAQHREQGLPFNTPFAYFDSDLFCM